MSPSTLATFDVSTSTPSLTSQSNFNAYGSDADGLFISHNGQFLVFPNGGGNDSGTYATYNTPLIPVSNVNGVIGTFQTGAYPGVATFSADDSKLYQVQDLGDNPYSVLKIFSTQSFVLLESFDLPLPNASAEYFNNITGLAITALNGYLYVAGTDGTINNNPGNLRLVSTQNAPFFNGSVSLADGFYYLQFPDGNLFGYYNFGTQPFLFHSDLGFEYPIDAADGSGGIFLYDFASQTFFYTSASLFPYLYDFTLNSFLYYYPDTKNPGHYTSNPRYFFNFATGQIITK